MGGFQAGIFGRISQTYVSIVLLFFCRTPVGCGFLCPFPGSRPRQYYIYKITPKQEELKEGVPIFESKIAPIQDGTYRTEGGLLQIYVPNMDKWNEPERVMRLEM